MSGELNLKLKIWRQNSSKEQGNFVDYEVNGISQDMSFLEMLDVLNQNLIRGGEIPVEFDHDCREGICGSCSLMINGAAHGPETGTATCQLHMRKFKSGDSIVIEPWRAKAFPVLKDLCVDRTALDRIIAVGGFVSVNTGNAVDANCNLVGREEAESAMDAAACIGCGGCVAACKNASASLFVAAKIAHLARLPQGRPERAVRVEKMVAQMESEGFGACSNTGACEAACPKEISVDTIAQMNRELLGAMWNSKNSKARSGGDG